MSDLEARVKNLEALVSTLQQREAIKDLRHTYWYSILDKNVDALVDCFSDDAELEYGFNITLSGRDNIRDFFTKLMGNDDLLRQIPVGANPLIDILDDNSANGRWTVEVSTLAVSDAPSRRIGVQYFESYRRDAEGWKICHMKNDYLYFEKPILDTEMT
jgi:ketosteroid isomerase-like protein